MVRRMEQILGACLIMSVLVVTASAAGLGTIRVRLDYGIPVEQGELVLYAVAEAAEGGYRMGQVWGGGFIRGEDACSPELARWLCDRIAEKGQTQTLDSAGEAEFTGLEDGLYLIVQKSAPEGWSCAEPFLIPLPLDGEWEVLACPKKSEILTQSPKTGQHPAPLFGAMGLVLSGLGLYFCLEKLRRK